MILFYGDYAKFSSISINSIQKFQGVLKSKYNLSERSIVNHLIALRAICNKAIRDGLMNKNKYPFGGDGIIIRIPSSVKVGLNIEEIKLLEDVEIEAFTTKWHARNAFLLSFYFAGARISDVIRIKWTDIVDGRLQYVMGKNNKVSSVKITVKAKVILDQYKAVKVKNELFVLPELNKENTDTENAIYKKIRFTTKKYNNWLKRLAALKFALVLDYHKNHA